MALHKFRVGDVFQPEDELSLYSANLAMAFNDLVFTNIKMDETQSDWEMFYWSRLAYAHFNEVMLYIESKRGDSKIVAFVSRLPEDAQQRYSEALRRYDENRAVLNRLRNETVFHYPKGNSVAAISKAISEAKDEEGTAGSKKSNKVKDARMFFADDLLARMVFNAAGGSEDTYGKRFDRDPGRDERRPRRPHPLRDVRRAARHRSRAGAARPDRAQGGRCDVPVLGTRLRRLRRREDA